MNSFKSSKEKILSWVNRCVSNLEWPWWQLRWFLFWCSWWSGWWWHRRRSWGSVVSYYHGINCGCCWESMTLLRTWCFSPLPYAAVADNDFSSEGLARLWSGLFDSDANSVVDDDEALRRSILNSSQVEWVSKESLSSGFSTGGSSSQSTMSSGQSPQK